VEAIAEENTMTRISTFCVLSSTLAVIALSANGASAATITVHTPVPRVIVHVPQPKVTVHTPQLKTLSNHGTVVGTKSGSNHVLLKGNLKDNSNEVGIAAPTTIKLTPNSPIVGGVPIIGYQEGNPDRPFIIGSVYNATPSFSFNKIDPAGQTSVVFVPAVQIQKIVDKSSPFILQGDAHRPVILGATLYKNPLGNTGDFNQQMQLRLQMSQDEYTKISQMISNTLKSTNATRDEIIGNFK
jgi:hypothetical protein